MFTNRGSVSRQAKRLLVQIVERCRNGPGFHGDGEGVGGTSVQEMLIPASKVGLVIGRGGDTIKQLQVKRSAQRGIRTFGSRFYS